MKMKISDLLPYKHVRYQESTNAFLPKEAIIPLLQEKDTTTFCTVQEGAYLQILWIKDNIFTVFCVFFALFQQFSSLLSPITSHL